MALNVLLIPDAFKDSLSSAEVAQAMKKGILEIHPNAEIYHITASDGGEGFLESVINYLPDAEKVYCDTVDPLGRPHRAAYLIDAARKDAYIELARASGLELLKAAERNPMRTSTKGTGIQIAHAIEQGMNTIYLGIGGSATNDAATGIASALGFEFLDEIGNTLEPSGQALTLIDSVKKSNVADDISFYAINDVLNPLYGPEGAAFTYAKQKGASQTEIESLEEGLQNISRVMKNATGKDYAQLPGAGAAGGTAYGLKAFLGAQFISGVSFLLQLAKFKELIKSKSIYVILTGEGCIDSQTAYGKLVSGVALESRPLNVPVVAVCGKLNLNPEEVRSLGLLAADQLFRPDQPEGYSYTHASELITERTRELIKLI